LRRRVDYGRVSRRFEREARHALIEGYRVLCIIPARGRSKGLPGKNIRPFLGKPLIAHSIAHAAAVAAIDRVVVSTDDQAIARAARRYGAEVPFMRPARLATGKASTVHVLRHALRYLKRSEGFDCEIVVLLQPTSPLRVPGDIERCIRLLLETRAENVVSVCSSAANPYFNLVERKPSGFVKLSKRGNFAGRQQAPDVLEINGAVYVWWTPVLMRSDRVVLGRTAVYSMPRERSVDIDDRLDFDLALALAKRARSKPKPKISASARVPR
jgi:CMP-N,N'-diacetyllegionaminic acid synthase